MGLRPTKCKSCKFCILTPSAIYILGYLYIVIKTRVGGKYYLNSSIIGIIIINGTKGGYYEKYK